MGTIASVVADPLPPSVSVALAISPSTYKPGDGEHGIPDLSITTILDSSTPQPVTFQTFATIFNPFLALQRRNFFVQDMSQDPPTTMSLEIRKGPRRRGFQRRKGHHDEKYYVTLYPGKEVVVKHPLFIVKRVTDGTRVFQAGHTYRFGLSDEGKQVQSWWWGTTDDVLDEVGGPPKDVSGIKGKGCIILNTEPVFFSIAE